jgi:GNAT superfamily N-acetyltransferase
MTVEVKPVTDARGAVTDAKLLAAAERVHLQLRPHLADYVARVQEVCASGVEMAVALNAGEVVGITMFRVIERTHSGRELYCDDLVTDETRRSTGVGHALMAYMEKIAEERGCDTFALDSGTVRQRAHQFYFREGLTISSFHFVKKISSRPTGIKLT